MTIFDTSGIEAWVTENNPKYVNRIIKYSKAFAKANNLDENYNSYKVAYVSVHIYVVANPVIQQIKDSFCIAIVKLKTKRLFAQTYRLQALHNLLQ